MKLKRRVVSTAVLAAMALPAHDAFAEDPPVDSVVVATEDESTKVSLGLDAQIRYSLTDTQLTEPTSAFRLRRFRPILGFEAYDQFEAKLVPEFAGGVELKDGVIGWSPNGAFSLEAGQFAPPFNWERDASSDYHQFTERSVANGEFQIADGRDIGVQFDYELGKLLDIEAGIFNGAGSNVEVDPGRGNLVAARVAYAPFGFYQEVEVIPKITEEPALLVGVGAYGTLENAWRDWSPPSVTDDVERSANVWSVTGDLHVWAWRMSLHAQVFHREVRACCDDDPEFATYSGGGFTGQAGFLLVEDRAMLAVRHSRSAADSGLSPTSREWAAALQIFHRGNRSKFTLEGGAIRRDDPARADPNYVRLQYQLLL